MQFSIRDLLWLMAVVALAATVYADRVHLRRLAARWEAESERTAQENAARMHELQAHLNVLRDQNAILQHQIVVELERERQREAETAERARAAPLPVRLGLPQLPRPPSVIDETDSQEIIDVAR
jgi:hypothetical protein